MPEKKDRNWDFNFDSGKKNLPNPIGYGMQVEEASSAVGDKRKKQANKALLEKKAWETVMAPVQSVGMNIFMIWMSGSSPGIFSVMMLGYSITSITTQFGNLNRSFEPYVQGGIDVTLQKVAYFAICTASLAYVLWHASGMGLLPTASGDWTSRIKPMSVIEVGSVAAE